MIPITGKRFSFLQVTTSERKNCFLLIEVYKRQNDGHLETGNDFLVKYLDPSDTDLNCEYLPSETDFEIRKEWSAYFASLIGNLLYLEHYTGPGPYTFSTWDLTKRQKVFEAFGAKVDYQEASVSYWIKTGRATKDNCPELSEWEEHGLGGAIETRVTLELVNFKISETDETRRRARQ